MTRAFITLLVLCLFAGACLADEHDEAPRERSRVSSRADATVPLLVELLALPESLARQSAGALAAASDSESLSKALAPLLAAVPAAERSKLPARYAELGKSGRLAAMVRSGLPKDLLDKIALASELMVRLHRSPESQAELAALVREVPDESRRELASAFLRTYSQYLKQNNDLFWQLLNAAVPAAASPTIADGAAAQKLRQLWANSEEGRARLLSWAQMQAHAGNAALAARIELAVTGRARSVQPYGSGGAVPPVQPPPNQPGSQNRFGQFIQQYWPQMQQMPQQALRWLAGKQQERSSWCWSAVTQTALRLYGIARSQTDIATRAKGRPINTTASLGEIKRLLRMDGVASHMGGGAVPREGLLQLLRQGKRVVAFVVDPGHFILLQAVSMDGDKIIAYDPGPGTTHTYTYENLRRRYRWVDSLIVDGKT